MPNTNFLPDEQNLEFTPLYFGSENCMPGYAFGLKVRPFYLIHYVISGCGTFYADGKEYSVSQNEMFIIRPGVENYYQADQDNPWSYIWIGFEANQMLNLPDVMFCPLAREVFLNIQKCRHFNEGKEAYLKAILWNLFAILIDQENPRTKYIDNALKYIHSNYMKENISIIDIAQSLNINRIYFSTLFKEKMGISPQQYLLNHRMNTAAKLLNIYHKSVALVAESVGYKDPYAFSKIFKKHFGLSPSEYSKKTIHINRDFHDIHLNLDLRKQYDYSQPTKELQKK